MTFESIFVYPNGRTARGPFLAALVTLLAVVLFYTYMVTGRTAQWCVLVLVYPAIVLHARRLHDMGHTAWLLLAPGLLIVAAFAIWLGLMSFGKQLDLVVPQIGLGVAAGFALWGCIGKGQTKANRY